jgi:uncharacterized protein (UPF0212 family)
MDYSWSDSSALYQVTHSDNKSANYAAAYSYLESRLLGYPVDESNEMVNKVEEQTESTVMVDGIRYYALGNGDVICPECGRSRSTCFISDHMMSEHSAD